METTIMESFQYYSWYSKNIYFYFCFIDRNLYNFLVFLKIIQISRESICTKDGKEQMLKRVMSLILIQ
jgi:hypothetical protein